MKKIMLAAMLMTLSLSANALEFVIDEAAILQLKDQIKLIKSQIKTLDSNNYDWSNAQKLIDELGTLVKKEGLLAYNSANVDEQFRKAYPGYQPPKDFSNAYKNNVNMTQNTLNRILQSMGASAQDFSDENRRLAFIQRQAQSAKGQLEAIQASAQISSEMVSQLQLLRQTVIAQNNAQTAYFATKIQTEANMHAELSEAISKGSKRISEYGTSGHYLTVPRIKE